jgi:hypothetical protein
MAFSTTSSSSSSSSTSSSPFTSDSLPAFTYEHVRTLEDSRSVAAPPLKLHHRTEHGPPLCCAHCCAHCAGVRLLHCSHAPAHSELLFCAVAGSLSYNLHLRAPASSASSSSDAQNPASMLMDCSPSLPPASRASPSSTSSSSPSSLSSAGTLRRSTSVVASDRDYLGVYAANPLSLLSFTYTCRRPALQALRCLDNSNMIGERLLGRVFA